MWSGAYHCPPYGYRTAVPAQQFYPTPPQQPQVATVQQRPQLSMEHYKFLCQEKNRLIGTLQKEVSDKDAVIAHLHARIVHLQRIVTSAGIEEEDTGATAVANDNTNQQQKKRPREATGKGTAETTDSAASNEKKKAKSSDPTRTNTTENASTNEKPGHEENESTTPAAAKPPRKPQNKDTPKYKEWLTRREEVWNTRYQELLDYKQQHGDCMVPLTYPPNPKLGNWVHTQRQYYRFTMNQPADSKKVRMTPDKLFRLHKIGFQFDDLSEKAAEEAWEVRFRELVRYQAEHGNCLVPSRYPPNPKLAAWVKAQRRRYHCRYKGREKGRTRLPDERIRRLEELGFTWFVGRNYEGLKETVDAVSEEEDPIPFDGEAEMAFTS